MFFYIFTCFFIFFFRRLAAIKHFLLYRTDVNNSLIRFRISVQKERGAMNVAPLSHLCV